MTYAWLHGEDAVPAARGVGDYIGSPMYSVIPEHGPVLFAIGLLAAVAWTVFRCARRGWPWALRYVSPYRRLRSIDRFLFWLLVVAGTVHLGLLPGHEFGGYTIAYLFGGLAELSVARRLLDGRPWRGWAIVVVTGSVAAYAASTFGGEPPDQVGLATKLVELAALAIVVTPKPPGRIMRLLASGAVVLATVVVALGAWVGAFLAVDGSHHLGEAAQPGTLIPDGEDREPTAHEVEEAEELYQATLASVTRYQDPAAAAADGYNVDGLFGKDFHAPNERYQSDGRIFDPERPENLIYAVGPNGPVLIGVLFEQEGIGTAGPAVGGPLTVWHAHDHVCFSLAPLALAGLTSPYGVCPLGSITVPVTNEMIHVWTVPGASEKFGHLDDGWLDDYLASLAT